LECIKILEEQTLNPGLYLIFFLGRLWSLWEFFFNFWRNSLGVEKKS